MGIRPMPRANEVAAQAWKFYELRVQRYNRRVLCGVRWKKDSILKMLLSGS